MKVAIIYNKDTSGVLNVFGMQNKEVYSPKTVKLVSEALEWGGHNVEIIDGNMHVIERLQQFLPKLENGVPAGLVFNMAYGIQGESRYTHIPSLLEMLGVPYVGSSPAGHALALDKVLTKILMVQSKLPTPKFWVFTGNETDFTGIDFPVIVKPKMESVSFGLRVVYQQHELQEAIQYVVSEFKQPALVEQFIRGREFCVGILGNTPIEAFPVLEIDLEGNPDAIQSAEDKKYHPKQKICPAQIDSALAEEMQRLSIEAFKALQLRDFARIDIRLDHHGNIYLLEINSMASLGASGSYVNAALKAGYDYRLLVNRMLEIAIQRYFPNMELPIKKHEPEHINDNIQLRTFIRKHQARYENLLEQFVNTNTHFRNVEGVNSFALQIIEELAKCGFKEEIHKNVEIGNSVFLCNNPDGEYDILLLGNLDNSKKPSHHEYYKSSSQKLYGTGIWENKGGLVVLIAAIQSLQNQRKLKNLKLGILLLSDNSINNKYSGCFIHTYSQKAKFVFGLRGVSGESTFISSCTGSASYKCEISLRQDITTSETNEAISSITAMVNKWNNLTELENHLLVLPSEFMVKTNIHTSHLSGEITVDVRFLNKEQFQKIDKKLRFGFPQKQKELYNFFITGGIQRPAFHPNSTTKQLMELLHETGNMLDIQVKEEKEAIAGEICFAPENKGSIDGFGPVGKRMQTQPEYILRYSLHERAALLANFLFNIQRKLLTPSE